VDAEAPEDRQNLVEESFCQYVIGSREPLIVDDAANDARTRDDVAVLVVGVPA
jgi:sigma-B regulation protein RsbU (phosphoserine phosphatase)